MQSYSGYGAMPAGFHDYEMNGNGPAKSAFGRGQRRMITLPALAACLFLPWFIFVSVYTVAGLSLHYVSADVVVVTEAVAAALVVLIGLGALQSWRRGEEGSISWYSFLFVTSLIGLVVAVVLGNANFTSNMQPYMDVKNMNEYILIDPTTAKGNQLMDAGRVLFDSSAKLDISHSMGFRNLDTYCVAPIVGSEKQDNYDFWAVGTNCCSGHAADFHCGEYNNPTARSGLRLMRDDLRSYFRLAVQQAEAAYNIQANHPIFFYWMQDPQTEILAYENAAYTTWMVGCFVALGIQLLLVVGATVVFAKYD
mmetsp:Transcript_55965/g.99661  ORF Transcript_55965/g.99661 Transcript_55965/m.99661 type:complete len:309 (-) Transcript_55965:137-1063(-)